jgi:hypothetical protein
VVTCSAMCTTREVPRIFHYLTVPVSADNTAKEKNLETARIVKVKEKKKKKKRRQFENEPCVPRGKCLGSSTT